MEYLHWKEETITDFSVENISRLYNEGFVFTRIGKGVMHQTRSVRIDLAKFDLSSENRRILKKVEEIEFQNDEPLPVETYKWQVAKMGKDFYDTKFGPGIMSVQKIKEMLTDYKSSNFTFLYIYSTGDHETLAILGYVIVYQDSKILHYSYPFYDLEKSPKDMGMGMMLKAIVAAKKEGTKYVYLGSLQRPGDVYKLQFAGLEWFDGKEWRTDMEEVKEILQGQK